MSSFSTPLKEKGHFCGKLGQGVCDFVGRFGVRGTIEFLEGLDVLRMIFGLLLDLI